MLIKKKLIKLFLLLILCGCAANKAYVIHPGSIAIGNDGGAFDSHTADYLSETRAFLDSFKGKTEPAAVTQFLSEAEDYYAKAKASYLAWRAAQTAVNLSALNQSTADLQASVGRISQAQGGQ